jgi:hypothetical protein
MQEAERDSGVQPERAYTVQRAVDEWLAEGLDGRSAQTVTLNRNVLKPVTAVIGGIELRMLTAQDVRRALVLLAAGNSSRTVTIAHNALIRARRHAEANRHVVHNVAALVDTSKRPARPAEQGADRRASRRRPDSRQRFQARCLRGPVPDDGIRTEEPGGCAGITWTWTPGASRSGGPCVSAVTPRPPSRAEPSDTPWSASNSRLPS